MKEETIAKVMVKPEYGISWIGEVYRTYNNGTILAVHPIDSNNPEEIIKVDINECERIYAEQKG